MPAYDPLDRGGEVVQQVPPVGYLHRVRGAMCGALGVAAGTIAADHLDAEVGVEPGGQRIGRTLGQDLHRPVSVHIDHKQ
jgi:hypothetical protein